MSTVKIRKILITKGLWESDTSIKIGNLLKQGLTTEEIAETLHMSVKNVQAYMPYGRGIYRGEGLSLEAIRSKKYRNRMKNAASMQVVKRTQGEDVSKRVKDMTDEKTAKTRNNDNDKPEILRLHLELNMKFIDDVGGIRGFCRMLQTMYECNMDDKEELEEKDSMQEWTDMMGWTGRKINPKHTL